MSIRSKLAVPPSIPFAPPAASPVRKAKLLGLAPQLDELYSARMADASLEQAPDPEAEELQRTARAVAEAQVRLNKLAQVISKRLQDTAGARGADETCTSASHRIHRQAS
jgi:hypothetical protein